LKTNLVTFFRAVANSAHAEIDQRVSIRQEMQNAGLENVFNELKKSTDVEALEKQIQLFEEEKEMDDEYLKKRFAHVASVKLDDINSVFEALAAMTKKHGTSPCFKEILQNLIALNPEAEHTTEKWVLAAKVIRRISYAAKTIGDVELARLLNTVSAEAHDILPLKSKIERKC